MVLLFDDLHCRYDDELIPHIDLWFVHLSELKFWVWRVLNTRMDLYLSHMREELKENLEETVEEKGPVVFGSEREFERKRVLKNGKVSMERIHSSYSLKSLSNELSNEILTQLFVCIVC